VYLIAVTSLLLILPVASVITESAFSSHTVSIIALTGKWFVFWAAGVRLFIAGIRQVFQPRFTAEEIFKLDDRVSFAIVRELGFANLSMGLLGIWLIPAAIVGGLYYGLAGAGHIFHRGKNAKEFTAMISDWFVFLVLLDFVLRGI
jgi:hypothetical protein